MIKKYRVKKGLMVLLHVSVGVKTVTEITEVLPTEFYISPETEITTETQHVISVNV